MEPIRRSDEPDRGRPRATARAKPWRGPSEHLLSLQDDGGWWKGELETNVSMDAEDMLLREFLGIREPETTRAHGRLDPLPAARRRTWSNFYDGPGDLSTTIEAYVALRLAGDSPEPSTCGRRATTSAAPAESQRARVFTHIWLALFGAWSWDQVPALPAELILLPAWFPLNVYDFACWARQTVVALSVVLAYRPRAAAAVRDRRARRPRALVAANGPARRSAARWSRSTACCSLYQRHPIAPLRRAALARAERWIVDRQEADGAGAASSRPGCTR